MSTCEELAADIAYAKTLATLAPAGSAAVTKGHRGLCPACREKFIAGGPEIPTVPFEHLTNVEIAALPSGLHESALNGYEVLMKAYDRDYAAYKRDFPPCPHPDAPFIREQATSVDLGDSKIKKSVLRLLEQEGPLSGGDIEANGVGVTKNNRVKIMTGLIDSGLVTMTKSGTAKFYGLA